jgi:hypothetical protein
VGIRAALNLRPVTALALLGLALTCASLLARAQQWTPQQRAACEPDAMRLCNQYVPDVQRVSIISGPSHPVPKQEASVADARHQLAGRDGRH